MKTLVLAALGGLVVSASVAAQDLSQLAVVKDARSRRISSSAKEDWSNGDNRHVPPGQTFTVAEIAGAGVIRHIWLTFPESAAGWISKDGSASPDEVVLRMYWDGSDQPAVEAPLGDFFAAGFGQRAEVRSTPVQVQGLDAYNCFWAMPFRSGAKITVTNESQRPFTAFYFQVDYTEEKVAEDAAYFCAQYRQEFPCVGGRDYLLADIEAPRGGHYVGTVLSVRQRSPQWFGEGDDRFYVDGEARASIRGTGTEDYFLCAWGFEKCTFPDFGVPWLSGEGMGQVGDMATMYRWHLSDPIRFGKSLRATLEHTGWMDADETTTGKVEGHVERGDDFASVAFWYQRGQPKRFTQIPPLKDRRLPSIDTVVDGQALLATAKLTGGGGMKLQKGGGWTGEGQLLVDGMKVGDALECQFEQPARAVHLVARFTHSYDFGVYAVFVDGKQMGGPLDLYSPTIEVMEHHLGELAAPEAGKTKHTLRLECVGLNPASKGAYVGLDSIKLRDRAGVKRAPLGPKEE